MPYGRNSAPLLSLVVPHHAMLVQLPRLLDSLLAQNPQATEVIVVDDASPEPCRAVIEAYRNKGLNLRLLEHQSNLGPLRARLAGIKAAAGQALTFADADDFFLPGASLEEHAASLLDLDADILHCNTIRRDPVSGREYCDLWSRPLAPLLSGGYILQSFLQQRRGTTLFAKIFRRAYWAEFIDCIPLDKAYARVDNLAITFFALAFAKKYTGRDSALYYYRSTPPEVEIKRAAQQIADFVFFAQAARAELLKHDFSAGTLDQMEEAFLFWTGYCLDLVCAHLDTSDQKAAFELFGDLDLDELLPCLDRLKKCGDRALAAQAERLELFFKAMRHATAPSDKGERHD